MNKTIKIQIAPSLSAEFQKNEDGRYLAVRPILAEEFRKLRAYAVTTGEKLHWGNDTAEFTVDETPLALMTFLAANLLLESINSFIFNNGNEGKCCFPKTGETADSNWSSWTEKDAEDFRTLNKAGLNIDSTIQKAAAYAMGGEIALKEKNRKQLLWLVYEPKAAKTDG